MKWWRAIRNGVVAAILALGSVVAVLEAGVLWDNHQLGQRLAHIDRALTSAHVTREPCAPGAECECRVEPPGDTFERCSIIAGHVALWIRSNEMCFNQWVAIDSTWAWDGTAERVGVLWISQSPRIVASRWSVLAVAPCLD